MCIQITSVIKKETLLILQCALDQVQSLSGIVCATGGVLQLLLVHLLD